MSKAEIDYGMRIKRLRRRRRLSQLALEAKASLAVGTVSRIENKRVNPTKETLYKLAHVMEVNVYEALELFGLDRFADASS